MLYVYVVAHLQLLAAFVRAIAVIAVVYLPLVLLWYYLLLKNTKLKAARDARGLTQEDLADLVEVSPRTVQRWESGKSHPHQRNLNALSQVLQISPEEPETVLLIEKPPEEMERVFLLMEKAGALKKIPPPTSIKKDMNGRIIGLSWQ